MSTSNSACEYCNRLIIHPFRGGQRFCCEACSDAWFAAERREAVEWYRACGLRPTTPQQQDRRPAMQRAAE
jgi:hypothetical protein